MVFRESAVLRECGSEDRDRRQQEGGAGSNAAGHSSLDACTYLASPFWAELGPLHCFSSFNPSCYQLLGKSLAQSPSWQNLPLNSTKRTKSSKRVTQLPSLAAWAAGQQVRLGEKPVKAEQRPWARGWVRLPGGLPRTMLGSGVSGVGGCLLSIVSVFGSSAVPLVA